MISLIPPLPLKGYRFPRSVVAYAVWAYHRFAMSLRDAEDLLAARGMMVSYETVRAWAHRFGPQMAAQIRRDRPQASDKWYLDEVVITISLASGLGSGAPSTAGAMCWKSWSRAGEMRVPPSGSCENSCATGVCRAWW